MKSFYPHLPENLAMRLHRVRRRFLAVMTVWMLLMVALAAAAACALMFVSDRFWDTPQFIRLLFLSGSLGAGGWSLYRWWRKQRRFRRDPCAAAQLVQAKYPFLGDSLQGIVELADETERPENISADLCRAAIRQVAESTASVNMQKAVSAARLRRLLAYLAGPLIFLLVLLFIDAAALLNAVHRLGMPLADVPRYTFARLEPLPEEKVIAHAEPFSLPVEIAPDSRWKPDRVKFRFADGAERSAPLEGGRVILKLEGQTELVPLTVRAGDAAQTVQVRPVFRPALLGLKAEVHYPDYLGDVVAEEPVSLDVLSVPKGSRVQFFGECTSELGCATLSASEPVLLMVENRNFQSEIMSASQLQHVVFSWQDTYGFEPRKPRSIEVEEAEDEAPSVSFSGMPAAVAVLPDEAVAIQVRADDDHGVKAVSLHWEVGSIELKEGEKPVETDRRIAEGGHGIKQKDTGFLFVPSALKIGEDKLVRVRAAATDFLPGRQPSFSREFQIYVLSPERHAKLLEEQLERIMSQIEKTAMAEEALLNETSRLMAMGDEELSSAESEDLLEKQEENQEKNRQELQNTAEQMSELIEEALRNEQISQETLQEWGELSQKLETISSREMQQAQQALASAGQSQSLQQRRKSLQDAAENQRKALEQLRDTGEKTQELAENIAIHNFAARLRAAAAKERGISAVLVDVLPRAVGLATENLPDDIREKIVSAGRLHQQLTVKMAKLQTEIMHYFSRTQFEQYRVIYQDMEQKNMHDKLRELTGVIRENRGVSAGAEARQWADQFETWAELLTPETGGGGGGGGGGEVSEEMVKLMVTFLKLLQGEQELRDQTGFLEQVKPEGYGYKQLAGLLAKRQEKLQQTLQAIEVSEPVPNLDVLIGEVDFAMDEVKLMLRRPQTDEEVVAAENMVIELLAACFQSSSSAAGSAATSLARMKMKMQGMAAGGGGGGSNRGGEAAGTPDPAFGEAGSAGAEGSDERKLSGHDFQDLPIEFRDTMEAFFKKVEE